MQFNIPDEFARSSGIYIIRNSINSKVYVGSAKDFRKRFVVHRSELKGNYHHSVRLQNFVNKYGLEVLSFDLLIYCEFDNKALIRYEQHFIDLLDAANQKKGFNISITAGRFLKPRIWPIGRCKNCNKDFYTTACKKHYCSNKCYLTQHATRETIPCLTCGQLFKQARKRSKYCSNECKGFLETISCEACNNVFKKKEAGQRFCSYKCSVGNSSKKRLTPIHCATCNTLFQRRWKIQKYCSQDCGWTGGLKTRTGQYREKAVIILCKTCNIEFKPRAKTSQYCSGTCAAKGRPRRIKLIPINCNWCNQEFKPRKYNNFYCCGSCASHARMAKRKKRIHLEPIANKKGQYLIPFAA